MKEKLKAKTVYFPPKMLKLLKKRAISQKDFFSNVVIKLLESALR